MINQLEIQNFQSHKKVSLQFSKGINSIVGISDSGKTALLRAIYWCKENRPLGNDDISDWNKDKDSEPIKSTFVRIANDKGLIERRKGKVKINDESRKFNGYVINGKDYLEAIGTSVPDIVSKMFNLDEVNFQGQFDPSFLLSNSAGEVARFFNSTIRLDLIDKILSNADSKRLETNKEKKRLEIEQNDIAKEIKKFDWLDNAEKLANKVVLLDDKIEIEINNHDKLLDLLNEYSESVDTISSQEVILSAVPIVEKIAIQIESIEKRIRLQEQVQNLYNEWKEQNSIIGTADFSIAEELIEKIEMINERIEAKEERYNELEESLSEWKGICNDIKDYKDDIIELERQLPILCPTCNKPLKEDICK